MTKTELIAKNKNRATYYKKIIHEVSKCTNEQSKSTIAYFKGKLRLVNKINEDLKTLPK